MNQVENSKGYIEHYIIKQNDVTLEKNYKDE